MLLLIDYSSMLYRAYHSTPTSVPMNGVYGFLNMLARVVADRKPTHLALGVDDDWRPAFRVEALPTYKAHRVSDEPDPVTPQEAKGREILEAMGLAVVGAPGYEAEDLIATLAERATGPVEILSGDRDLFDLVRDPDVKVLYPVKGVSTLAEVTEGWIEQKYGIPGRRYGDYALLRGDPSDGLPGVAGIGEKTAAKLIAEHGSLEALLASPRIPPKIAAGREYLEAARRVVLPVRNVAIPEVDTALPRHIADPDVLQRAMDEHKLGNAIARAMTALGLMEGA